MIGEDDAAREQQIVDAFVELARIGGDVPDGVAVLQRLASRTVQLVDRVGAGILLRDGSGALRIAAASDDRPEALRLLRAQHENGPSIECLARGVTVVSTDLTSEAARWPEFARVASAQGVRSVVAMPLRVDGELVGALNLFGDAVGPRSARDLALAQGLVDVTSVALARERALRRADATAEHLQRALTSRIVIEQAKGLLAARLGLDVEAAFDQLRAHARDQNRRLGDLARVLVDGGPGAEALIAEAWPQRHPVEQRLGADAGLVVNHALARLQTGR